MAQDGSPAQANARPSPRQTRARLTLERNALWSSSPTELIAGSTCQALGKPNYSLYVSLIRQLAVLLPAAWLLSLSGNLSLVWLAFPIAEIASLIVSTVFLKKTLAVLNTAETEVEKS